MAMSTTALGIQFEELQGSPQMGGGEDGVTARREFRVPDWSKAIAFVREAMGYSTVVGSAVSAHRGVKFPGGEIPFLFAESFNIVPFNSNPAGATFTSLESAANTYAEGARVTIEYRQQNYSFAPGLPEPPTGTYYTFQGDLGAEYAPAPKGSLKWKDNGQDLPPGSLVSIVEPTGQIALTWHRVPHPPFASMDELLGCCNQEVFLGKPKETVLYAGSQYDIEFRVESKKAFWKIRHNFSYRHHRMPGGAHGGWNHFLDKDPAVWRKIVHAATFREIYEPVDFGPLFQFGPPTT